jgi:hypothetical protein
MPPPCRHLSTIVLRVGRPWAGVVRRVPHGVPWGWQHCCAIQLRQPGDGRSRRGWSSPGCSGMEAGEPLLCWAGAGVFCAATGGAERRKGRRKKGRQDQAWEKRFVDSAENGGRRRSPEGALRPEGPARGNGGSGATGPGLHGAEGRRAAAEGRAGPGGTWAGAQGGRSLEAWE